MEEKKENRSLSLKSDSNLSKIYDSEFENLEVLMNRATLLISKGLIPQKTPEAAVNAVLMGKEMNLPAMFSMNHINYIKDAGRPDVHAKLYVVRKAGIILNQLEDYVSLHQYADLTTKSEIDVPISSQYPNGKKPDAKIYREDMFPDDIALLRATDLDAFCKRMVKLPPYDYRTTWSAERYVKVPKSIDNQGKTIWTYQISKVTKSYTQGEAIRAGLIKPDGKGAWANWEKRMVETKCLHFLLDLIAPDIIYGGQTDGLLPTEQEDFYIKQDLDNKLKTVDVDSTEIETN